MNTTDDEHVGAAPDDDATAATGARSAILVVAHDLIAERGNAAITLVEVAARAGYSRQTLYQLFGNRAGLLHAMLDQMDRSPLGASRLAAARSDKPAPAALEAFVRAWCEYLPVVLPVARALIAAASSGDQEAHAAWQSRRALLLGGFTRVMAALHRDGALREGWTEEAAADWAFALTHVDTWHHLVVEAGWPPSEASERLVEAVRSTLLQDPSTSGDRVNEKAPRAKRSQGNRATKARR